MLGCFVSLDHNEIKGLEYENSITTLIETLGIICMWQNCFYYLKIFDDTNHLVRMITEVCKDMGQFLLIFCITHVAFAETFFFVSFSSA